jgi:hypothetical protein
MALRARGAGALAALARTASASAAAAPRRVGVGTLVQQPAGASLVAWSHGRGNTYHRRSVTTTTPAAVAVDDEQGGAPAPAGETAQDAITAAKEAAREAAALATGSADSYGASSIQVGP